MKHIIEMDVEKYIRKEMGALKNALIKRHIKKCRQCAELIEKRETDMKLLEEVKKAVQRSHENASESPRETVVKLKKKLDKSI